MSAGGAVGGLAKTWLAWWLGGTLVLSLVSKELGAEWSDLFTDTSGYTAGVATADGEDMGAKMTEGQTAATDEDASEPVTAAP